MTLNVVFRYVDIQNVKILSFQFSSTICARLWGAPLEKTHKQWQFGTVPTGELCIRRGGWTEETVILSEGMRVSKAQVRAHWVTRERSPVRWSGMCRGKGPKPAFWTHQIKTVKVNQARPTYIVRSGQWSPLQGQCLKKITRGFLGAVMSCSLIWLPVKQVCSVYKKWATGTIYKYAHFSVCRSQFNKELK